MSYKTIGDLDGAFKEARRRYAMQIIATNDAEGIAQSDAMYLSVVMKHRLAAAENSAKAGRFTAAMTFLAIGASEGEE